MARKILFSIICLMFATTFVFSKTGLNIKSGGDGNHPKQNKKSQHVKVSETKKAATSTESVAFTPLKLDEIDQLFLEANQTANVLPVGKAEQITGITETNGDGAIIAAIVVCAFLGGLGIHRLIMGGRAMLILIYFITCGGIFGVVPLVDFILLIVDAVNGGGSRYEGNDKFIAW